MGAKRSGGSGLNNTRFTGTRPSSDMNSATRVAVLTYGSRKSASFANSVPFAPGSEPT